MARLRWLLLTSICYALPFVMFSTELAVLAVDSYIDAGEHWPGDAVHWLHRYRHARILSGKLIAARRRSA